MSGTGVAVGVFAGATATVAVDAGVVVLVDAKGGWAAVPVANGTKVGVCVPASLDVITFAAVPLVGLGVRVGTAVGAVICAATASGGRVAVVGGVVSGDTTTTRSERSPTCTGVDGSLITSC